MNTKTLNNIKERYAKIYIIADEDQHKLLSIMKDDILALISAVESYQAIGTKTFESTHDLLRAV